MAAQRDQDPRETRDGAPVPPLPGEIERERTDIHVVSVLGAVALLVAVGMWFYTKDKEMIAGDGTTIHQTTGTRSPDMRSRDSRSEPGATPRSTPRHSIAPSSATPSSTTPRTATPGQTEPNRTAPAPPE